MSPAARSLAVAVLGLVVSAAPLPGAVAPAVASQAAATTADRNRAVPAPQAQAPQPPSAKTDARETRGELRALLERQPPSLGRVLKLDPLLLGNDEYLAPYPAVRAFLTEHPEVRHNPAFYLEHIPSFDSVPTDARSQAIGLINDVLEGTMVLTVILIVIFTLVWLIRTLIDYRRWNRLTKTQTEVHSKLLDRFSGNEDLLAYIQTPAGRRFLESAPISVEAGPRAMSAPIGRILWSVQAGVVMAIGGLGLQLVSARLWDEIGQLLSAMGMLAFSLGTGFVLSAVVAYVLSRRLGLLPSQPGADAATERGGSA